MTIANEIDTPDGIARLYNDGSVLIIRADPNREDVALTEEEARSVTELLATKRDVGAVQE